MRGARAASRGSLGEKPGAVEIMDGDTTEVIDKMTDMLVAVTTRLNTTEVLTLTMTKILMMLTTIKDDTTEVLMLATMTIMLMFTMTENDTTEVLTMETMTELPGEYGQCEGRPEENERVMR